MAPALPPRRMAQQLVQGHLTFGALISYWRGRSRLSGNQLVAIANWGLGEKSWLDSAVISRIENGRQARGCSMKNLLAFDAANQVINLWQTDGKEACWDRFGLHTVWGVSDQWIEEAIWLPVPKEPEHAMEFADFAEVLVGLMAVPYLGTVVLGDVDAEVMSGRLSDLLNAAITAQGLSPREAMKELLKSYPTKDPDRQSRLMAVSLGQGEFTREELESELYALSEAIRALRELPPGSYGPGELAAELSAPPIVSV